MKEPLRTDSACRHYEKGQVLYLAAITMTLLLIFLTLIIDAGLAYAQRRRMQNAADAAAAAGTRVIVYSAGMSTDADVKQAIDTYAQLNGGSIDYVANPPYYLASDGSIVSKVGAGGNIPSNAAGVMVTPSTTVSTFFAVLLGHSLIPVAANAATISYPAQMPNNLAPLAPLTVPQVNYVVGSTYVLWSSQYEKFWADYGYALPSDFKGVYDQQGQVAVNTWVPIVHGDHGHNISSILDSIISSEGLSDAGGSYGILELPVFDTYLSDNVHVTGFAAFKIYPSTVNSSNASGRFVQFVVPGGQIATGGGAPNGPRVVKLVQPTFVPTPLATSTPWPTPTPVATATSTPSGTATATSTPAATLTQTATPTPAGTSTPTPTPCPSVLISNVSFSPVGNSGKVDVSWSTNVTSDSLIEWGTSPGSYGSSASDIGLVTSHSLDMYNIAKGTVYYYRITSTNSCSQSAQSTGTFSR